MHSKNSPDLLLARFGRFVHIRDFKEILAAAPVAQVSGAG